MSYRGFILIIGGFCAIAAWAPPVEKECRSVQYASMLAPLASIVGPINRGLSLWPQSAFGSTSMGALALLQHPDLRVADFGTSELSDMQIRGMGIAMSRLHAAYQVELREVEDSAVREFWTFRLRDPVVNRLGDMIEALAPGTVAKFPNGVDGVRADKNHETTLSTIRHFLEVTCQVVESDAGKEISGRFRSRFRLSTPDPLPFLDELKPLVFKELADKYPDMTKRQMDALWDVLAKPLL